MVMRRLPWLLGTILGWVAGLYLAGRTSDWLAQAAGWRPGEVLENLRAWRLPDVSRQDEGGVTNGPEAGRGAVRARTSGDSRGQAGERRGIRGDGPYPPEREDGPIWERLLLMPRLHTFRWLLAFYSILGGVAPALANLNPHSEAWLGRISQGSGSEAGLLLLLVAALASGAAMHPRILWGLPIFGLVDSGIGELSRPFLQRWIGSQPLARPLIEPMILAVAAGVAAMVVAYAVRLRDGVFTTLQWLLKVRRDSGAVLMVVVLSSLFSRTIPSSGFADSLGAVVFLAAMLTSMGACFWWATRYDLRPWRPVLPGAMILAFLSFGVVALALRFFMPPKSGVASTLESGVNLGPGGPAGLALLAFGAIMTSIPRIGEVPTGANTAGTRRASHAAFVAVFFTVLALATGVYLFGPAVISALVTPGIVFLGAVTVSTVARSGRPEMAYPLAVIFGISAFAVAYNSLSYMPTAPGWLSWWGALDPSLLPSAISTIALTALATSIYIAIKSTWPGRGALVCLFAALGLFVFNGNAWFVASNQFKVTFPGLEQYYLNPVYLDTRAYFRDSVAGVAKLRNRDRLREHNRRIDRPEHQVLSSVYFKVDARMVAAGIIEIHDPRGRLRVRTDDRIRILKGQDEITARVVAKDGDKFEVRLDRAALEVLLDKGSSLPEPGGSKVFDRDVMKGLAEEVTRNLDERLMVLDLPSLCHGDEGLLDGDIKAFVQAHDIRSGDCIALEDRAAEDSVVADLFVASTATGPGPIPGRGLAPEADRSARDRYIKDGAAGSKSPDFHLRIAQDRGLFRIVAVATNGEWSAVLYNGDRAREEDRIILRWGDPGAEDARTFRIKASTERMDDGGHRVTLCPEEGHPIGRDLDMNLSGTWQVLHPLNNLEVLRAWKRRAGSSWPGGKPPLVILTVSGGGIRSSVWATRVLTTLEHRLGRDFPAHIRLITGASGGMVGASYYATSLPLVRRADRAPVVLDKMVDLMAEDQLNEVVGCMAFSDVPGLLNPLQRGFDRGRALERAWQRLTRAKGGAPDSKSPFERPLRGFAADELLGRRPSLIFTPMMVEDGRRLLISNLDMSFATRSLGGMLLEPGSSKVEAASLVNDHSSAGPPASDQMYSMGAMEFFRLFPSAHGFRVSTATRMSASFPWISPAVSLPTLPSRRVVDAGYYDNYGVNVAALWLDEMRDWLVKNTSGVLVIQIRDHVSQDARTEVAKGEDWEQNTSGLPKLMDSLTWKVGRNVVEPGLQPLNTPLHGVSTARQWSMSFRNDEQLELIDGMFDEKVAQDEEFFRTVVFECPVEAALSWTLSDAERTVLKESLPIDLSITKIDKLKAQVEKRLALLSKDKATGAANKADIVRIYSQEWEQIGLPDLSSPSPSEGIRLYENLIKNVERLNLLVKWWEGKKQPPAPPSPGG